MLYQNSQRLKRAPFLLVFSIVTMTLFRLALSTPQEGETQKARLQPADYLKWESLRSGASLSPNGNWLACTISRGDGTSELRVYDLEGQSEPILVAEGTGNPLFSDDSKWLACQVGYSEVESDKLREKGEPVQNKLGLLDLASGNTEILENVKAFSFSDDGAYLAMHKYPVPSGKKEEKDPEAEEEKEPASGLIVRRLADGTDVHFGSVSSFSWQEKGNLLALTIEAQDQAGNGIQLFNPDKGSLAVLDSGKASYAGLAWRKDADDLAVFRSLSDDEMEGSTRLVLAWRGLSENPARLAYDHAEDPDFPEGMRVARHPDLHWSKNGQSLFFGIREWRDKSDHKEKDADSRPSEEEEASNQEKEEIQGELKPSEVRVWHSQDERTIPMQEKQKQRDLQRSFLSAWHLDSNRFVRLGTDLMERVSLVEGEAFATETDRQPYRFDNMFDRPRHDIYLINTESGERQIILEEVWHFQGSSPTGRYLLYFTDGHYRSFDVEKKQHTCLTCDVPTSFVNEDYDIPVRKENPPWGSAGWLKEDKAVLLYDKFDIWSVAPDGSSAENLTKGAESETVYRYVQLNPEEEFIDPANPVYVSQFGYWNKKQGYARLELSAGTADDPQTGQLVWMDKQVSRLIKAKKANSFAYLVEAFDDSPDYFVAGPDLADARRITHTNPFQEDYSWGSSELLDYQNSKGERLQAVLTYPAGHQPDQRYPMIVYVYEKLSRQLHQYSVPSERRPYNPAVFSTQGYFVLRPDISYTDRDPGVSAVDCVSAAVSEALKNESIDASKVGLVGHSWGGYEASFIPTQTDIFAAAIAGAPLTNFFSFYGTFHWGPGMPESQHFETGQGRMDVPFWEDQDAYLRNSPVIFIDKLNTPMMLFFGDADGTVDWHQGVEFYNYARRAGKNLVMLVYPGEDHGARKKENQIDYHRRILSWFGHYLKGEEAPEWITEGVTALERQRQLQKDKKK